MYMYPCIHMCLVCAHTCVRYVHMYVLSICIIAHLVQRCARGYTNMEYFMEYVRSIFPNMGWLQLVGSIKL